MRERSIWLGTPSVTSTSARLRGPQQARYYVTVSRNTLCLLGSLTSSLIMTVGRGKITPNVEDNLIVVLKHTITVSWAGCRASFNHCLALQCPSDHHATDRVYPRMDNASVEGLGPQVALVSGVGHYNYLWYYCGHVHIVPFTAHRACKSIKGAVVPADLDYLHSPHQ